MTTTVRPASYLLAVHVFSLEHLGLTAEIDEFFVLPSCRRHGHSDRTGFEPLDKML